MLQAAPKRCLFPVPPTLCDAGRAGDSPLATGAPGTAHCWESTAPAEPYLGTPECKQQSHEAAPSPARAAHGREAAQLLGLSSASGSLPARLPSSLHASPVPGSPQVSLAPSLSKAPVWLRLSWGMGRQVWHSTVRSPFLCSGQMH